MDGIEKKDMVLLHDVLDYGMIDFLKMLIEVALSRQKFGKQYGAA